jgi:hypothetical protein
MFAVLLIGILAAENCVSIGQSPKADEVLVLIQRTLHARRLKAASISGTYGAAEAAPLQKRFPEPLSA